MLFGRKFYTLWKGRADGTDEPMLLKDEKFYKLRSRAFKRARYLANQLAVGWGQAILVRRIKIGSIKCVEYVFEPEGLQ